MNMAAIYGVTILVNAILPSGLILRKTSVVLAAFSRPVCVCWSVLPWSVPHVFDITVTRLSSLSGEMENVRDQSRETSSFPTSDGMRNTLIGWLAC